MTAAGQDHHGPSSGKPDPEMLELLRFCVVGSVTVVIRCRCGPSETELQSARGFGLTERENSSYVFRPGSPIRSTCAALTDSSGLENRLHLLLQVRVLPSDGCVLT